MLKIMRGMFRVTGIASAEAALQDGEWACDQVKGAVVDGVKARSGEFHGVDRRNADRGFNGLPHGVRRFGPVTVRKQRIRHPRFIAGNFAELAFRLFCAPCADNFDSWFF